MSWAADEWKSDLTHRAQQKVEQLEGQLDRMRKESEMKQFKMDSMEQVIQKEKRRMEDEKAQVAALKRETQCLSESCQDVEQKRQKLATDLHAKDSHINALNGQIAHTKKQLDQENNKVSQLQASVEKIERHQMGQGDKYEKLSAEHDKVKQMNQHQTKECSALRSECSTLKHRISEFENQLAHMQGENSHMKSQLKEQGSVKETQSKHLAAELKTEKENMKLMEKKTSEDIKNMKHLLEKREKEFDKLQMDSKSKEDKLASMLKAVTTEMQNLKEIGSRKSAQDIQAKSKLEENIGELTNSAAEKEQENSKLNKDLKFLRDSLTNAQTNAESLKIDLKNKEALISQQKETINNMEKYSTSQCQEMGNENEKIGKQLKSVSSELENVKDQNKNTQSLLDKKERELDNFKVDFKNLTGEKDTLEKKLIGLEKTKDALSSALSQIKNEMQKLINMNGLLKQEVEEQQNIIIGKEREISQLQSELSHNSDRLCDTQKQLDNFKSELRTSEENMRQFQSDTDANKCVLELEIKELKLEQVSFEECNKVTKSELEKAISEKSDLLLAKEKNELLLKELQADFDQVQVEKSDFAKKIETFEHDNRCLRESVQSLRTESDNMTAENIELAKTLDETRFTLVSSESKSTSLEQKFIDYERKFQETVESLKNVTADKEELVGQQQNLLADITELNATLEAGKVKAEQEKEKIETMQQQILELKDDFSTKESDYTDCQIKLNEEVQCLKNTCIEKDEQIKALHQELVHSEEKLEAARNQFSCSEQAKHELEGKANALQIKLEEISFTLMECSNVKDEHAETIDTLKKEMCSLKDELNSKALSLEQCNAKFSQELENLKVEFNGKNIEVESLQIELLHSNENMSHIQKSYEETCTDKKRLEEDIVDLNKTSDQIRFNLEESQCKEGKHTSLINDLQKEVRLLKDDMDVNTRNEVEIKTALQQEIEEQKNINHGKDSEIHELKNDISHKVIQLEGLQVKYDSLFTENGAVEVQCQAQLHEIGELKFSINNNELNVTRSQETIVALQSEIKTVKDAESALRLAESEQKANLNQNIEELHNVNEGKNLEISQLQVEVGHVTERLQKTTEALASITDEKCEAEVNVHVLQTELEELKHEIGSLKSAADQYQSIISDQLSESQALKDQFSELSMEVTETKSKLHQKIEELQNMTVEKESEINSLKAEVTHVSEMWQKVTETLESVTSEKGDLEVNVKQYSVKAEEMKHKISELISANERYQTVIAQQQLEIGTLKDELSDLSIEDSISKANMKLKIEEVQNMADIKESEVNNLRVEISHISERLQNVTESLENTNKSKCDAEMNVKKYQIETEELKLEISNMKSVEDKHQSIISLQISEIQTLKDELSDLSTEESINKAKLKQQLDNTQSLFNATQNENEHLTSKLNQTEETLAANRSEIELIKTEKAELVLSSKQQDSMIEEFKFTIGELTASSEKHFEKISDLQHTVETMKDELSDMSTNESITTVKFNKEIEELKNISEGKDLEISQLNIEVMCVSEKLQCATETLETTNIKKSEYEMSVLKYQTETEELKHALGELKSIEDINKSVICAQQSEIQTLKDQVNDISVELSESKVTLNLTSAELLNVREGKDTEIKNLNVEVTHILETLQKTTDSLECTKSEKCDAESAVKTYQLQTDRLQHQLNELKSDNEQHESIISKQKSEIQTFKDELSDLSIEDSIIKANMKQKTEEFENITEGKDSEITDLKAEVGHISESLQKVTEALENTNKIKNDTEMNVQKYKIETEELKLEITELRTAHDRQESIISMQISEIQTLKDDLSDLSTEESVNKAKLKQEVDELQTLIVDSQKDNEQLHSKLDKLEEIVEKKRTDYESVNSEKSELLLTVKQLETRIADFEFSKCELTASAEKYTEMISALQLANKTLKDQLSDLSTEESVCKVKLNQKIDQLQNVVEGKDREISQLQTEVAHVSECLQNANTDFDCMKAEQCEAKLNVQQYQNETDELRHEIGDLKSTSSRYDSIMSQQLSEIKRLKDELSGLSTEGTLIKVKLTKQVEELQNVSDDMQKTNEQLQFKINEMAQNIGKKNTNLEMLGIENSELILNVKQHETTIAELKSKVSNLTDSAEKYVQMVSDLQTVNATLKDDISDLSTEESVIKVKLNQKINELQNVTKGKDLEINELKSETSHVAECLQTATAKLECIANEKYEADLKVKQYQIEAEEMKHEISELKSAHAIHQSSINDQQFEIQTLKDQINDLSISETSTKAVMSQEIIDFKKCCAAKDYELENLLSELSHKSENLNTLQDKLEVVGKEKQNVELTVQKQVNELGEVSIAMEEIMKSKQKLENKIDEIESEKLIMKNKLSDQSAEYSIQTIELKQELEAVNNTLSSKIFEMNELSSQLTHTQDKLTGTFDKLELLESSKKELDSKVETYSKKTTELEHSLSDSHASEEKYRLHVEVLEKELNVIKDALHMENTSNSSNAARLNQEVSDQKNILTGYNVEITKLELTIDHLKSDLATSLKTQDDLQLQNNEKDSELREFMQRLEELNVNLCTAKTEEEANKETMAELQTEVNFQKDKFSNHTTNCESTSLILRQNLEENTNMLEEKDIELLNSKAELSRSLSDYQNLQKSIFDKESKLQDISEQLMQVQNEFDTFRFEADTVSGERDAENNLLMEKINDLNIILEKNSDEKIATTEALEKKTSQLQVSQEDCEEMQEQVLELENKLTRHEKENNLLEKSVQNFTDRLTSIDIEKSALARCLEEKQNIVDGMDIEIKSMREELTNSQEKLQHTQDKVTGINDNFISTEAEMFQLKQIQESKQFDTEQKLQELEIEVKKLNEKLELSQITVTDLEKKIVNFAGLIESEKEITKDSVTKHDQIQYDHAQTVARLSSLENEKNVFQCQIESLKSSIQQEEENNIQHTQKHSEFQNELQSARLSIHELETQLSVLHKEKNDLMENVEMMINEKTMFDSSLLAAGTTIEELKFTLSEGQHKETEMQILVETLKENIQQLQDASNDTSVSAQSVKAELETILSEKKLLLTENENSIHLLQDQLNVAIQNLQECEEKYTLASQNLHEANSTINKYEIELQDLKLSQEEVKAQLLELHESEDHKRKEIHDLKDSINYVTNSKDGAQATYEQQLSDLSNTLAQTMEEITAVKDELDQKTCALLEAQENVLRQTDKASIAELQVRTLQEEMDASEKSTKEKLKCQEIDSDLLQDTVSNMQSELETVTKQNAILQQNLELAEENLQESRSDKVQVVQEKECLEKELLKIEEDKLELANTIEHINAKVLEVEFEEGNYRRKLGETEQELQSTQAFSQNLQSQLEHADGSYKSLQDKIYELSSRNTELETNLQQTTIEFERVKLEFVDKAAELQDVCNKKNENDQILDEEVHALQDKVTNMKRRIGVLEEEKEEIEADVKCYQSEKLSLVVQMDVLENKLTDGEQCSVEASNRVSILEGKVKQFESDFKDIEIEKEQYQTELSKLKMSTDVSQTQLSELEEEIVRRQSNMDQLMSENKSLMSQLNKSEIECQGKASVIQELDDTVDKLKETLESCDNANSQQKKMIQELSDTVDDHNNTLNILRIEQSKISTDNEIISAELTVTQEENKTIKSENEHFNETVKNLKNENKQIEAFQTEIENYKLSVFAAQEELESMKKCVEDKDNEIQRMQTDADKLESKVRNLETEKDELEHMVEFSSMDAACRDDQVDELQNKYSETSNKLEDIQREVIKAGKEIKELNNKNSDLTNLITELQSANNSLEDEVKMKSITIQERIQEVNVLKTKIKELDCDLDNFKDMMESLEFENASLETEKRALQSEKTNFSSEKTSLLCELGTLKNDVLQKEQQLQDQCGKLKDILAKDQEKHSDITDSLNAEIIELQEKYTKTCKTENCLMDENKILKAKLDSMDLSFSSFDSQKSELIEVKSELQTITSERISMQQKVATQDREKNELLSQFLALEDKKSQVDRQNAALRLQVDDLSKTLDGKDSKCKSVLAELANKVKDIGDLECQMGLLQCDVEKLREVNIELVGDITKLRDEMLACQQEKANLEQELNDKESLFTCEKDKLQRQTEELQTKLDSLEMIMDEQASTIESLRLEQAQLLQHKSKVVELQEEITALKAEMKEGLVHINSLTGKLKEKEKVISTLKQGGQDVNNKERKGSAQTKEELEQTLEKWASRCSKLNAQLTMEKKNVTKYREQVQSLKANVEQQVKEQTGELTKQLESAQKSAAEYLDKYHALTRRYTQLEADCQKLQMLLNPQTAAESALFPKTPSGTGQSCGSHGQTSKNSVDNSRPATRTTPKPGQHRETTAGLRGQATSPGQNHGRVTESRNITPKLLPPVGNSSHNTSPAPNWPVEASGRPRGRDLTPKQVKQEPNSRTQLQERVPNNEGQPVAKRLRNSEIGTSVDKLVEDEHPMKRKSPRCLSRSKLKSDVQFGQSDTETMMVDSVALSRSSTSAAARLGSVDGKRSLDASRPTCSVSSMVNRIEQTGNSTRSNNSSPALGCTNGKPVSVIDTDKLGPKGLRPKLGRSSTLASVSSGDGVTMCRDVDTKIVTRTRLGTSHMVKDGESCGSKLTKMDESTADGSKPLLGNTSTLTRSQTKLGGGQPAGKKALETITNSPVKKVGGVMGGVPGDVGPAPMMALPQRVLSLKKSPQVIKTRRRAREEESILADQEESPECKVN